MKIQAVSLKTKGLITITGEFPAYRLERKGANDADWYGWTAEGFIISDTELPLPVPVGDFIDNHETLTGVYAYRCCDFDNTTPLPANYEYSNIVRYGNTGPIGWSFGNYQPPPGEWGELCTPDDLRETWIWGTEFKATNGALFTDEQIRYFIDNATAEIERRLNITIKKKRVRCDPEKRNLEKGKDYDVEDSVYDFKLSKIQRYGKIVTRYKPIIKLHRLITSSRFTGTRDLTPSTVLDKRKGLLKLMERPIRPNETARGIQTAINMYGTETLNMHLFYEIDYDAGYETVADVPPDIRTIIGKVAAVSLLNVIGDGLMSGFASSSLSMDGMSESFSSTQCATSAYFGARVKVYQDEIEKYISENLRKFGTIPIGSL